MLEIKLWPEGLLTPGVETTEKPSGDGVVRIDKVYEPSITIYRAEDAEQPGPLILVCPGGGYGILAINKEGSEIAQWLNSLGVHAAVLKYRVPHQRDNAFADAQRAIRILRGRANEFNLDKERIGMIGFSAGAHLSARVSGDYKGIAYQKVDDFDELSARPDFVALIYPAYLVDEENKINEEIIVDKHNPPVFVLQTQDDSIRVENAIYYALAARDAKLGCEMHIFAKGGHGYGLRPQNEAVGNWPNLMHEWLKSIGAVDKMTRQQISKGLR